MEINSTLNLTQEDVKKIIKEWLKNNSYDVIGDIELNVGRTTVGYGSMEQDIYVFQGANCKIKIQL